MLELSEWVDTDRFDMDVLILILNVEKMTAFDASSAITRFCRVVKEVLNARKSESTITL